MGRLNPVITPFSSSLLRTTTTAQSSNDECGNYYVQDKSDTNDHANILLFAERCLRDGQDVRSSSAREYLVLVASNTAI